METLGPDDTDRLFKSALYKELLAEREEILCHKWIESEKLVMTSDLNVR
jgi:hypothetical protein